MASFFIVVQLLHLILALVKQTLSLKHTYKQQQMGTLACWPGCGYNIGHPFWPVEQHPVMDIEQYGHWLAEDAKGEPKCEVADLVAPHFALDIVSQEQQRHLLTAMLLIKWSA